MEITPKATKAAVERSEAHFAGHGGCELFYQTWKPKAPAMATKTLVVTHGISEHSECYARTAEDLVALGWNVCAWDLRGHGRSEGKRGFVENFQSYSLDLGELLKVIRRNGTLDEKFALFGHSMGGLITLRHLVDDPEKDVPRPQAAALSAPALGFSIAVPKVKDVAARVFNRVLPSITLYNEIKYADLTHDSALLKSYALDPLRHDKISPAVYLGMIESFAIVTANASSLRLPILVQLAGQERLVSAQAIKDFFPLIGSAQKKLVVYEESYHEIFNDLQRDKAVLDLDGFLTSALGGRGEK